MVTVTLMKTAVAKNLSQSIIICVGHQHFSKSIRQPCQYPILGECPGIPWLPLRYATNCNNCFMTCYGRISWLGPDQSSLIASRAPSWLSTGLYPGNSYPAIMC